MGDTYAANAILKAEAARDATGLASLADDSGLEVECLGGRPGLRSARLAPDAAARISTLLAMLSDQPKPWRARFVCAIALAAPDRPTGVFEGTCEGEIVEPRDGGSGFGYDPVFLLPELGLTFAQLDGPRKHLYSHRGRAFRALVASADLEHLSAESS